MFKKLDFENEPENRSGEQGDVLQERYIGRRNEILSDLQPEKPMGKLTGKLRALLQKHKYTCLLFLIAYFVPVIIVSMIYAFSEVYPIGGQCFLKTDMYHQYAPFFSEFRHKLVNGESLFFTWDVGMGINFFAVMAYYLASPFNWLVYFAGENSVIEFMQSLTIIKIGLSGVAFTAYIRSHARRKNDCGLAIFGIAYALSGYMCAYYWNTMWLDCIILFPLIIGALENLVRDGRMFRYALLLGLCIVSNYYISIMVCIFLVIYFAAMNVLDLPENFREFAGRCLRFAAGSLTAGALAAVFLLPAFYALQATASASSTFPKVIKSYFSVVEMLARMQPIVQTEQALAHWPNIYSGTFVFVLFPLYLMCGRIPFREKAVYCVLSLLMLGSFSVNALDYLWHGMHFPNSLPCRQSFCFILLVLFMCFRAYERKESYTVKQLGIALLAAVAFLLYAEKGADTKYFDYYVVWVALGLCGLYVFVLVLYQQGRISRVFALMCALLLAVAEFTANAAVTGFTTCSRAYYTKDNGEVRELVAAALETSQGEGLWRFEKGSRRTKNDGAWLNFPSVSLFSSTASASVSKLMTKLGCEASTNAYSITGATPLVDMLLSVRWYLSGTDLSASGEKKVGGRTLADEYGDTWLYENNSVLPVAYVLPARIADGWCFDFDNPALIQNSICDAAGVSHVLVAEPKTGSSNGNSYTIYTGQAGEYFAYVTNTAVKSATVNIDGDTSKYENLDRKYMISLGQLEENTMLKFTSNTDGQDMTVSVYRVDYGALEELCSKMAGQAAGITSWNSDSVEFTIRVNAADAGYGSGKKATVFIGTPYDEGWQITVDGAEMSPVRTFDGAFLGLELDDGVHTVRMKFVPKGFMTGILISIGGFALLLLLLSIDRWNRRKRLANRARLEHMEDRLGNGATEQAVLTEEREIFEETADEIRTQPQCEPADGASDTAVS